MRRQAGRWSAVIVSVIVIGGLGWCGWRWWDVRRNRSAMAAIDDAMRHGRYATAARQLSARLERSPGSDRDRYLLGVCEKASGRLREADTAWAAIPPNSPFLGRAVAGRMDLLIEQGRFAAAENLIELAAAADFGAEASASAIRLSLIPILIQEGRAEEARRLVESRWQSLDAIGEGEPEQAVNLARLHMELRWDVPPSEPLRDYLDRLSRLAPDDDRIWLARANLATRSGQYDDAGRLLDDCLRLRPDDAAVWRARLVWSLQTDRLAEARAALGHLPPDLTTPAEVHHLAALLASKCGDSDRERRELADLAADAPEDLEALERLETLEPAAETAASRRRQREEIERDQKRYRALYHRNQPARDAEEMARLAERLGQRFEAILFLTVAIAEEPNRAELRRDLHRLKEAAREPDGRIQGLVDRLPKDCAGDRSPLRLP